MAAPSSFTGAPCWLDLLTTDKAGAEKFYGALFGWTAEQGDQEKYGGYVTFSKDGQPVAGCMDNDGSSGMPDLWNVYLASADAAATVKSATEHGGRVYMEPMAVPEQGTMAMVGDPGGSAVGVWQPGPFTGIGTIQEPGTPGWFELFTRSYEQVVGFYRDVFGWETQTASDTPEFRYTTLGSGDVQAAGIMDASGVPDEERAVWSVYFAVDSADDTAARATELGGKVVRPPEDTPYGRLATLADPTGAAFKVIENNLG